MKYHCEISGTIIIEANSEEEAKNIAKETAVEYWDWNEIEVEEW